MSISRAFVGALVALIVATPVTAQETRLTLTPFAGMLSPTAEVPSRFTVSGDEPYTLLDRELEGDQIFGAAAGIRAERVGLELSFGYSPLTFNATREGDEAVDASMLLFTGNGMLYVPTGIEALSPYLSAGVGAKVYRFDLNRAEPTRHMTLAVGGGLQYDIFESMGLRLDVRDYISTFEGDGAAEGDAGMHDLQLSVGLSFSTGIGGSGAASAVADEDRSN